MRTLLLLAGLLSACIYDSSERCGPAMRFDAASNLCVCDDNAIPSGLGCTPCAPDEVVVAGVCACPTGTARAADGACELVRGLGDACNDTTPCTDDTYHVCAPATAGATAGTCTNACASNDDCAPTSTCATWDATPYCRAFSGVGKSCASNADCAGMDAALCDTYISHSCIVAGCSLTAFDCPRGLTCCSLASYGLPNVCAGACL